MTLSFKRLFRWHFSMLWGFVSYLFSQFKPLFGRRPVPAPDKDLKQLGDTDKRLSNSAQSSEEPGRIIVQECPPPKQFRNQELLIMGVFADVYLMNKTVVRKLPRSGDADASDAIHREATVYSILGDHPRIAECLSSGRTNLVDVMYYPHGDLATFLVKEEDKLTIELQNKWFRQIIEAVVKIHKHDVIHSDLALRQFFLDDKLDVRLGDFNLSQYPGHPALGYEEASHCLPRDYYAPNSVTSDLFALGSTLYELVARKSPYSELYYGEFEAVMHSNDPTAILARTQHKQKVHLAIENHYRKQEFPDVTCLRGGNVILGCWKGSITSALEALELCLANASDPELKLGGSRSTLDLIQNSEMCVGTILK